MSDTPRTDACEWSDGTIRECDELAELCRQLERELAAAKRGVVVPREPTKEMLEAGGEAFYFAQNNMVVQELQAGFVFDAMLSAAPQQIAAPNEEAVKAAQQLLDEDSDPLIQTVCDEILRLAGRKP